MKAAILMTYRAGDTPDRHANLLATLNGLALSPTHEVIIVEQDVLPTLSAPLPHPNCRAVFAYNPGPFNKSWGFNIAARLTQSPVLIFSDADVIVPDMLDKSIGHCLQGYAVVKPYRRIVDLSPAQTDEVRAGRHDLLPSTDASQPNREGQGEFVVMCGGQFVIRATHFYQLGGWDERFRGWGGEDDAMSYAIQRARLPTLELDERPALHLWHPRSTASTSGHPHYRDNCLLVARYRQYSEAELLRLAEVNRHVMGHQYKYQPAAA